MMKYIKLITVIIMSSLYINVGIKHFTDPSYFLYIMPPYLPFPKLLVYLSGFLEMFFGVLLLFNKYRSFAGWGLLILLFLVFPANIYLAQSKEAQELINISTNQAILRLPFQLPMIILAYWHTKSSNNLSFFSTAGFVMSLLIFIIYNFLNL